MFESVTAKGNPGIAVAPAPVVGAVTPSEIEKEFVRAVVDGVPLAHKKRPTGVPPLYPLIWYLTMYCWKVLAVITGPTVVVAPVAVPMNCQPLASAANEVRVGLLKVTVVPLVVPKNVFEP